MLFFVFINEIIFRWHYYILADKSGETKYQCGICSDLFDTKEMILEHNVNLYQDDQYTCCRCEEQFATSGELQQHHELHKEQDQTIIQYPMSSDEEVIEVLNYDNEEIIVQPTAISDTSELLYILEDSQCVNEVVIQDEDNQVIEKRNDNVAIVNLEHGYMIAPEALDESEEQLEEFQEQVLVNNDEMPLITKLQPSTSKKIVTPKPRAPQPKRRHEVPDFSASNYDYINANEEVDVPHYKCLRCEQLFINKIVFFRHIEKGKCYINNCDVCSETFTKNSDFYLHYVSQHTDRAICNFCFRTFMYEKNVKEHMLRHLDQFRHRCEKCNKGFYTVREYRNHYKNRHMGIRHKCEICTRTFADEYYFKRHIATHAKVNNITLCFK